LGSGGDEIAGLRRRSQAELFARDGSPVHRRSDPAQCAADGGRNRAMEARRLFDTTYDAAR